MIAQIAQEGLEFAARNDLTWRLRLGFRMARLRYLRRSLWGLLGGCRA